MGYIHDLRALVGQRALILVGTLAVLRDGAGAVLLIRRGDFGNWSLPGGFLELGQSLSETVAREVEEETGLMIGAATPFAIYSEPRHTFAYPNGDQVQPVTVAFLVESWSGELRGDGDEALEVAFFPLERLPDTHPFQRELLADVQTYLNTQRLISA